MSKLGYRVFTSVDPTIMFSPNPSELTRAISAIISSVFMQTLPDVSLCHISESIKLSKWDRWKFDNESAPQTGWDGGPVFWSVCCLWSFRKVESDFLLLDYFSFRTYLRNTACWHTRIWQLTSSTTLSTSHSDTRSKSQSINVQIRWVVESCESFTFGIYFELLKLSTATSYFLVIIISIHILDWSKSCK